MGRWVIRLYGFIGEMSMCEPATIAMVGAAAISAYSSYSQGKFQKEMGERNATLAEWQANDTLERSAIAQDQQRAKTRQIIGAQRAAEGASGAQVDSGSFGLLTEQTAEMGERDVQTIRSNALKEAWGYGVQAQDSRAQGDMAAKAGTMQAAGTLLGAAGKAYGPASKYWGSTGSGSGLTGGGGLGLKMPSGGSSGLLKTGLAFDR